MFVVLKNKKKNQIIHCVLSCGISYFFRIMANRPFWPVFPLNWEGQMAPLRGLKEDELRLLDILLCKSH